MHACLLELQLPVWWHVEQLLLLHDQTVLIIYIHLPVNYVIMETLQGDPSPMALPENTHTPIEGIGIL